MNIRRARLEDLDIIVEYNYNLAYETENKELDKEILTKGVKNIIEDENKGVYHVCEIDGKVVFTKEDLMTLKMVDFLGYVL